MLCQICQNKTAEIKISHVINNKKMETNLCKKCAEEKGMNNPLMNLPKIFGNFITELIGEEFSKTKKESESNKCSKCGTTWEYFQKNGLLGCDNCYKTFQTDLNHVLRRIHGSNQHIGSRPKSCRQIVDDTELDKMKKNLHRAIKQEKFEKAAELRDIIRDVQREIDKRENDGILR